MTIDFLKDKKEKITGEFHRKIIEMNGDVKEFMWEEDNSSQQERILWQHTHNAKPKIFFSNNIVS